MTNPAEASTDPAEVSTNPAESEASSDLADAEAESSTDRWFRLARRCERILSGARPASMRERLADLMAYTVAASASASTSADDAVSTVDLDGRGDMYGDGVVSILEERVARLLGKQAAVFFPTGTMAQQVALRCWAERTGKATVALHPHSHLELHERLAYTTLTGLRGVWPTNEKRPPNAAEIRELDESFGTLLLELPQREAGFVLPTFEELTFTVEAARERGARVHFDGARLWETTHHFGQELPTIAALADSVYVSFYKTLGGISGAALAGDADFAAAARAWRHRYGGNVFQQWPAALSALHGLDTVLPHIPSYVEHAAVVSAALVAALPGAIVHPAVPHTHQFQLWLPHPAEALNAAVYALAEQEKIWFAGRFTNQPPTPYAMTEITILSPALSFSPTEVTHTASAFLSHLPS